VNQRMRQLYAEAVAQFSPADAGGGRI